MAHSNGRRHQMSLPLPCGTFYCMVCLPWGRTYCTQVCEDGRASLALGWNHCPKGANHGSGCSRLVSNKLVAEMTVKSPASTTDIAKLSCPGGRGQQKPPTGGQTRTQPSTAGPCTQSKRHRRTVFQHWSLDVKQKTLQKTCCVHSAEDGRHEPTHFLSNSLGKPCDSNTLQKRLNASGFCIRGMVS